MDGASVDADAEGAHATCGALPDYGSWLPVTQAPGTIPASVTDATGAPATASAAYTIVPPLPAPETAGENGVYPDTLTFYWYTAEPPPGGAALVAFLLRWREVGTVAWTYEAQAPWRNGRSAYGAYAYFTGLRDPVAYEAAVAPMRHPLEAETPAALRWTPARQATTVTYPANVTATTTHDTVTVRWDRQPSVTYWDDHSEQPPRHLHRHADLSRRCGGLGRPGERHARGDVPAPVAGHGVRAARRLREIV